MEFIVKQGNNTLNLNNRKPLRSVTKAEHRQTLLSEDVVNISVESVVPLVFHIGDVFEYENRRYTLNFAPKVKREQGVYTYDLVFEGVQYLLRDKIFFNTDTQGYQTGADFSLTGDLELFITTIRNNINAISNQTWLVGEVTENTETKTLTFNNENCLAVLQRICQEYDTEFDIVEDLNANTCTLNIKKIGTVLNQTFEYGKGNGLYSLTRENVNNDVITRLYVYGSTENLKSGYRGYSQRLRLPVSHGADYIQDDAKVALFGLKEGVKNFDIKPTFKGVISQVSVLFSPNGSTKLSNNDSRGGIRLINELKIPILNHLQFVCNTMDFDLKEVDEEGNTKYLLPGTPAKIHVNKGNLAGYEFEIVDYNHAEKKFTIRQFEDENGQRFPDEGTVFSFANGDEFTLIDIAMPEQYITNAENKLLSEGKREYQKLSVNNLKYNLDLDPMFLQKIGNAGTVFFAIGDYIRVVDDQLNVDKSSRIVNITRDLLDEFNYKLSIADTYEISFVASMVAEIKDTQKVIKTQEQINRQNFLSGYRHNRELRDHIFDTDGYFDPTHIKPASIETNMLSVGAKSQQFALENITLNPNVQGDPARVSITSGKLVHFSLEDNIREWDLLPYNRNDLLNQLYYVYAKCERGGNNAMWHITTEKIKFDSETNYFYFLCFILYTPNNGKREAEAMYGNVLIHGGQISAGRIKSTNGQTYFDLDSGEIAGTIKFLQNGEVKEVGNAIEEAQESAVQTSNTNLATTRIELENFSTNLFDTERVDRIGAVGNLQTQINQVNTNLDDLGTMAWENSVEQAMLGSTIVQGGYIKTELLNASAIVSNGGGATTTALSEAINGIVVGGRNFLKNSKKGYELFNNNSTINTLFQGEENGVKWISGTKNSNGEFYISTYWHKLDNLNFFTEDLTGQDSVQSIEVMPTHDMWIGIAGEKKWCVANEWTRIEHFLNHERFYGIYAVWDGDNVPVDAKIYHRNWKLEKGNKATDWSPAPEDIQDQFSNLQQGISNMQTTLSDVQGKTDNFSSIQGGLMMANVMSVGSDQANQNAFLSGVTDNGDESVRFGAGANYENKNTAPFRVLDNGKVIAENAEISGVVNATSGKIGDFYINETSLNTENFNMSGCAMPLGVSMSAIAQSEMVWMKTRGYWSGDEVKRKYFGAGDMLVNPNMTCPANSAVARIDNTYNYKDNIALHLRATGANDTGIALKIEEGGVNIHGHRAYTGEIRVQTGQYTSKKLKFIEGILYEITN